MGSHNTWENMKSTSGHLETDALCFVMSKSFRYPETGRYDLSGQSHKMNKQILSEISYLQHLSMHVFSSWKHTQEACSHNFLTASSEKGLIY